MPFRLIMDNIPTPIFVKDDAFRIIYANKAFMEIYAPERRASIIGTTTVEEFTDAEAAAFINEDRRAFELGQTELVEEIVSYTGQKRVFLTRKMAFTTSAGETRLLGICNDISELHERERSLAAANVVLQSFSALAAHDLRSPLASIVTALEFVQRDEQTRLSERSTYYVDMMKETACSLSDNIECLLATNKLDRRGTGLRMADCDLNLALAEVKFRLSSLISRHNALIYACRLPTVAAEATLMRQLLQNLIENSIKYRRPAEQLKITLRYEDHAGQHRFELDDNGRGMANDIAERAFDLYEQGDAKQNEGAGLGLALCRRIVDMHGGTIDIDPEFLTGCRIRWSLPKVRPTPDVALSA